MSIAAGPRRTAGQILEEVERLEKQEQERQAQEAKRKRICDLQALAQRETEPWQQVEVLVQSYQAKLYDEATRLLVRLHELAVFQGTQAAFDEHLGGLCIRYKSRSSFIERLRKAGLLRK